MLDPFNKYQYMKQVNNSILYVINMFTESYFNNFLLENVDISKDLEEAIVKLNLIREFIKDNNYEMFYNLMKEFILTNSVCKRLALVVITHPTRESNSVISLNNNEIFGASFIVNTENFMESVNSNLKFLFLLKDENGKVCKEVIDFWKDNPITRKTVSVFYKLNDDSGEDISLQIMVTDNFSFDIQDLTKQQTVKDFLIYLLKENEELKDSINIAFRKYLGNKFSLF